jgi:hypothetical protein
MDFTGRSLAQLKVEKRKLQPNGFRLQKSNMPLLDTYIYISTKGRRILRCPGLNFHK